MDEFVLGAVLVPVFLQAWWPPTAMAFSAPAWSLSVEAFFYALFPFLLSPWRPKSFLALSYALVLLGCVARSLLPDADFDSPMWNFAMFFPVLHLPQFLFGMALGRLLISNISIPEFVPKYGLLIGVVFLLVAFGFRESLPNFLRSDAVLTPLYALIILSGAFSRGGLLHHRFWTLLGEASYALYAIHMPLGWIWWSATKAWDMPTGIKFIAFFATSIALSVAIFVWIEKPLRRRLLGHRAHRAA